MENNCMHFLTFKCPQHIFKTNDYKTEKQISCFLGYLVIVYPIMFLEYPTVFQTRVS